MLSDHVLLRLSDFADDPPIFITVRTRTKEGSVSSDSNVCRVPRDITNTSELTNRTTTFGVQSNLVQRIPSTGVRPSLISSLAPISISVGQTSIATTIPTTITTTATAAAATATATTIAPTIAITTTITAPPPPITTTAMTDLLQTSQGNLATINNLMNNSMMISRPTYGNHHITPGLSIFVFFFIKFNIFGYFIII
ncbi:unnamed protein product [Brugia timori]|uniref:RIMS-binding protein 1/2/3 Fn3 domain-containing protein n=1 Tax=Brugia timori TaxID=42155 RepID=A0A0R3R0T7_9BILA|nr:unnamed protein product [Brugia timori]